MSDESASFDLKDLERRMEGAAAQAAKLEVRAEHARAAGVPLERVGRWLREGAHP